MKANDEPITLKDKVDILLKLATILERLHKSGVAHTKLNLNYVLLSSANIVSAELLLAGFGNLEILSDAAGADSSNKSMSLDEKYLAPEQLSSEVITNLTELIVNILVFQYSFSFCSV